MNIDNKGQKDHFVVSNIRIDKLENDDKSSIDELIKNNVYDDIYDRFLSINDLVRIQPNYPTDDEGNPLFTAGSGVADLEVFYEDFNLICEVTMLSDRSQWVAEGQPVQRHLFEFSKKYPDKEIHR